MELDPVWTWLHDGPLRLHCSGSKGNRSGFGTPSRHALNHRGFSLHGWCNPARADRDPARTPTPCAFRTATRHPNIRVRERSRPTRCVGCPHILRLRFDRGSGPIRTNTAHTRWPSTPHQRPSIIPPAPTALHTTPHHFDAPPIASPLGLRLESVATLVQRRSNRPLHPPGLRRTHIEVSAAADSSPPEGFQLPNWTTPLDTWGCIEAVPSHVKVKGMYLDGLVRQVEAAKGTLSSSGPYRAFATTTLGN